MGQELHDGLGQQLLGLRLMAASLAKLLEGRGLPEAESARELADGLMGAQDSVRALIKGIRPVEVDARGLMTGLAELADRTEQLAGIPCVFHCAQPARPRQQPHGHAVVLHGGRSGGKCRAACPRSSTSRSAWHATISVWSCGCAMTAAGSQAKWKQIAGMGMRIMRHRAAVISAVLTIEPAPEGGTLVTCVVPAGSL